MDGSRLVGLVCLCRPDLGHASNGKIQPDRIIRSSFLYLGPRWWVYGWDYGLTKNQNGFERLGLCLPMVLRRPTGLAANHARGHECKPLAPHSSRLGTNFWQLLEILVCLDATGRGWLVGSGIALKALMARDSAPG